MATDPNLTLTLDHDIAEVGGVFTGSVHRAPTDGESNDQTMGKIRNIRVSLRYSTEGRGDTDSKEFGTTEFPGDEYGMTSGNFSIDVPEDGPISYDGGLIRVRWSIRARTDRQLARDDDVELDVLVIPTNGTGYYDRPHPIRA